MSVRDVVERHAAGLEDAAAAMARDNIGLDNLRGHASVLKRMAASMRADAAMGRLPHRYDDSAAMYASAPRMSASARATVDAAGLSFLLATDDQIAMADLNVSLAESGTSPEDRMVIKQALASAGKLTA